MLSLPKFFNRKFSTGHRRRLGFSLIELLIVISLFALVAVIVTVSYIGYESREEVKNAALQMVTDIRGVQNKAKTGDKISNSAAPAGCSTTTTGSPPKISGNTLQGWYIKFDNATDAKVDEYEVGAICAPSSGNDYVIGTPKVTNLPVGVSITKLTYGSAFTSSVPPGRGVAHAYFKPIDLQVTFHDIDATLTSAGCPNAPSFADSCSVLGGGGEELLIELSSTDGGTYQVKITPFGAVEAKKL